LAGPTPLYTHLVDTGRTFIYDTALPPAVAAGAVAALRLLRQPDDAHAGAAHAGVDANGGGSSGSGSGHGGDGLRAELADRVLSAVRRLRAAGLEVVTPAGGVLSVTAASAEAATAWAGACRAQGVAVGCFRPPSTPDSRSRLRLTVNVGVPRADFDAAIDIVLAARP
jgi:8-amino-7-oxononanoate synthase